MRDEEWPDGLAQELCISRNKMKRAEMLEESLPVREVSKKHDHSPLKHIQYLFFDKWFHKNHFILTTVCEAESVYLQP